MLSERRNSVNETPPEPGAGHPNVAFVRRQIAESTKPANAGKEVRMKTRGKQLALGVLTAVLGVVSTHASSHREAPGITSLALRIDWLSRLGGRNATYKVRLKPG
jgi:hypothetical protein